MRQIKSPGEIALLTKAIDLSVDAQLAAMRMVRPGLYEYQVAARWWKFTPNGGCETEAYAPIVGTGLHSTILHFNELDAQIQDGDVVLMDVGGQYAGYTADITRTIPANGHFTPRQREIYDIVLGAQNAVLAAMKPGMTLGGSGPNSLFKIAYDYMNTHGTDREGRTPRPLFHSRSGPPYRPRGARRRRSQPPARTGHGRHRSSRGSIFPKKKSACASRTTC